MPDVFATADPSGRTPDPVVLLNLLLIAHLYARGLKRLWRAGVGRGVAVWRAVAFAGGLLAAAAALASPLDPLSDQLASAHMVQHMLLANVAAPLVILGAPSFVILSGVPTPYRGLLGRAWRRLDAEWLRNPLVVGVGFAVVLWGWHHPALYQAALRSPAVHDLEHLTFFLAACLFWRVVLDPVSRRRANPLAGVLYLFAATLHATALGVFMALAPRAWYPVYEGRTEPWGLTALEDQQLAGLIMWMPGCLVYAVAAAGLLVAWIGRQE